LRLEPRSKPVRASFGRPARLARQETEEVATCRTQSFSSSSASCGESRGETSAASLCGTPSPVARSAWPSRGGSWMLAVRSLLRVPASISNPPRAARGAYQAEGRLILPRPTADPQPLDIAVEGGLGEPQALPGRLRAAAVALQAGEDELALEGAQGVFHRNAVPEERAGFRVGLGLQDVREAALHKRDVEA